MMGTMAKDDTSPFPSMDCPICAEPMEDPISLKCMHTYCRNCLLRLIMDQQVDERHSSIQNIRQLAERNIFDQGYGRDFMHNGRGRNVFYENRAKTLETAARVEYLTANAQPGTLMTNHQMRENLLAARTFLPEAINFILPNKPVRILCSFCRTVNHIKEENLVDHTNFAMKSLIDEIKKFTQTNEEARKQEPVYKCGCCSQALRNGCVFVCRQCNIKDLCGNCIAEKHLGHQDTKKIEIFDAELAKNYHDRMKERQQLIAESKTSIEMALAQIQSHIAADVAAVEILSNKKLGNPEEGLSLADDSEDMKRRHQNVLLHLESLKKATTSLNKLTEWMVNAEHARINFCSFQLDSIIEQLENGDRNQQELNAILPVINPSANVAGSSTSDTSRILPTRTAHVRETSGTGDESVQEPVKKQKRIHSPPEEQDQPSTSAGSSSSRSNNNNSVSRFEPHSSAPRRYRRMVFDPTDGSRVLAPRQHRPLARLLYINQQSLVTSPGNMERNS
ncbi:hypothetical protein WR25_27042 [Diploscapter pachys]|uniref:RING-type domain-containing protein n=1 Tax=Diploscapter pachys TaxID=2018661 RepID=A0A2A2KCK0_9BILA|nr:hypothetical protein WR25_27042 [Diploscapter pachys]